MFILPGIVRSGGGLGTEEFEVENDDLSCEPCVLVTSVVHQSGEGNLAKLHRLSRNPFPRVASLQMKLLSIVNIF